jgi:hypothetical protein
MQGIATNIVVVRRAATVRGRVSPVESAPNTTAAPSRRPSGSVACLERGKAHCGSGFLCLMQAMRRQGEDARECSGADGNHQQQTNANRLRPSSSERAEGGQRWGAHHLSFVLGTIGCINRPRTDRRSCYKHWTSMSVNAARSVHPQIRIRFEAQQLSRDTAEGVFRRRPCREHGE